MHQRVFARNNGSAAADRFAYRGRDLSPSAAPLSPRPRARAGFPTRRTDEGTPSPPRVRAPAGKAGGLALQPVFGRGGAQVPSATRSSAFALPLFRSASRTSLTHPLSLASGRSSRRTVASPLPLPFRGEVRAQGPSQTQLDAAQGRAQVGCCGTRTGGGPGGRRPSPGTRAQAGRRAPKRARAAAVAGGLNEDAMADGALGLGPEPVAVVKERKARAFWEQFHHHLLFPWASDHETNLGPGDANKRDAIITELVRVGVPLIKAKGGKSPLQQLQAHYTRSFPDAPVPGPLRPEVGEEQEDAGPEPDDDDEAEVEVVQPPPKKAKLSLASSSPKPAPPPAAAAGVVRACRTCSAPRAGPVPAPGEHDAGWSCGGCGLRGDLASDDPANKFLQERVLRLLQQPLPGPVPQSSASSSSVASSPPAGQSNNAWEKLERHFEELGGGRRAYGGVRRGGRHPLAGRSPGTLAPGPVGLELPARLGWAARPHPVGQAGGRGPGVPAHHQRLDRRPDRAADPLRRVDVCSRPPRTRRLRR